MKDRTVRALAARIEALEVDRVERERVYDLQAEIAALRAQIDAAAAEAVRLDRQRFQDVKALAAAAGLLDLAEFMASTNLSIEEIALRLSLPVQWVMTGLNGSAIAAVGDAG